MTQAIERPQVQRRESNPDFIVVQWRIWIDLVRFAHALLLQ